MRRNTSKDPTLNSGTALLLKPLLIQGQKVLACDWTPQTVNMSISIQGDCLAQIEGAKVRVCVEQKLHCSTLKAGGGGVY